MQALLTLQLIRESKVKNVSYYPGTGINFSSEYYIWNRELFCSILNRLMPQWKPQKEDRNLHKSFKYFTSSKLVPSGSSSKDQNPPNPQHKYLDHSSREHSSSMSLVKSPGISSH